MLTLVLNLIIAACFCAVGFFADDTEVLTGCSLISFFWVAYVAHICFTTEIAITDMRIIVKKVGGLSSTTSTVEMRLDKVEGVQTEQSGLGASFGYGNIVILGVGGAKTVIKGVSDPMKFRSEVFEAQNESEKKAKEAA